MTARFAIVILLIAGAAPVTGRPFATLDSSRPEPAANPASQDVYAKPVTKQQIKDLVAAGMNSAKLAPVLVRRGINFDPTAEDLAALRKAGATEALIKALQDAPQFAPGSVPPDREVGGVPPTPAAGRKSEPASKSAPLDKLKLLRLVVRGTPNSRIVDMVETAGLDFTPTDEFLDTLQIAGADEAVRAAMGGRPVDRFHEAPPDFSAASDQPATAGQADDDRNRIFQAGEGVTPPKGLYTPDAAYTEEARRKRIEGMVALDIVVEASGDVSDVTVAKSLDPGLDASAVETVRKWRFEPGTRDGRAVRVAVRVEMTFKLLHSPQP